MRCRSVEPRGKCGHYATLSATRARRVSQIPELTEVCVSHTDRRILQAEPSIRQTRYRARLPDTSSSKADLSAGDVGLLLVIERCDLVKRASEPIRKSLIHPRIAMYLVFRFRPRCGPCSREVRNNTRAFDGRRTVGRSSREDARDGWSS